MSVLQKALAREGLQLTGDVLPKKDRKVKVFQRVIAAIRAAEAEMQDRLSDSERELSESLRTNLQLEERVRILENELQKFRLRKELESFDKLTSADKKKLIGAVHFQGKEETMVTDSENGQ